AAVGLAGEAVEDLLRESGSRRRHLEHRAAAEVSTDHRRSEDVAGSIDHEVSGRVLAVLVSLEAVGDARRAGQRRAGQDGEGAGNGESDHDDSSDPGTSHAAVPLLVMGALPSGLLIARAL